MYKKEFEVSIDDMKLIEEALFKLQVVSDDDKIMKIYDLRGRLHNQKIWYGPKDEVIPGG